MACRKVIVNSVEPSHYSKMFEDNNMGISVDIENVDALAEAVIYLKNHPKKLDEMSQNSYNFGKENYSSDKSIKKLIDVFEKAKKKQ